MKRGKSIFNKGGGLARAEGDTPTRGVFTRRALLVLAAQAGVFGVLSERLYNLQVVKSGQLKELAARNRTSKRFVAPARGLISDRFGVQVASNKENWRALFMPEETTDAKAMVDRFSQLVALSDDERARIFRDLKHLHKYVPVTLKDYLSWDDMARIELNAYSMPGVLIDVGATRRYPFGPQFAHIVGYVAPPNDRDIARSPMMVLPGMRTGRAGIERSQDARLRGQPGAVEMEVNALGRVLGEVSRVDGQQGEEVVLTIDASLQEKVLSRLGGQSSSAVVMDCRTGEVLAMASTPSFDPSLFDSGVSRAQWQNWMQDSRAPLINKAVCGVYPPGSTFKPAVALAALKSKRVTPHDEFECPGYYDLGGTRFHCWARHGHGRLNMQQALMHSCDVYFYKVANLIGMSAIKEMANRLGLGVKPAIELLYVKTGNIPSPIRHLRQGHSWSRGDTVNAGIGQGYVQVTPLELATYVSRIASGRMVSPHLIRRLGAADSLYVKNNVHPEIDIPDDDMEVVRRGMFDVVNAPGGTAPRARLDLQNIQMAGKTGSAQVRRVSRALRESGHFNSMSLPWLQRPHALFICYAPFDSPQYAVAIVIEHGNGGASAAAPVARDIMLDVFARDPVNRHYGPGDIVTVTS